MTTAKQSTAKQSTKKVTATKAIDSVAAQAGALTVTVQTVQTRKTSKALEPLAAAMKVAGDETTVELLARLPQDTVAFRVFSSHALGTAQLFSWFDDNRTSLTRTTKENKVLLDIAGAYVSAFNITHDKARDGALKNMPFYKKFSNALQQWAQRRGGVSQRASGAITDTIGAYLNKKQQEDAQALEDSLVAWVLKHECIMARIKSALETPAA